MGVTTDRDTRALRALVGGTLALGLLAATPASAQFVGSFDSINEGAGGPPAVPDGADGGGGGAPPPPPPPDDQADATDTDAAPPPPPPPPQTRYYVLVNGAQTGPFTPEEIRRKAANGEISAATLVWTEGMAQWTEIGEVSELASLVPASKAPAAPETDFSAYIRGGWGTRGQNVDLGDGLTGDIVILTRFGRDNANVSMQIDTVVYGQRARILGEGGGPFQLKPLGGAKFQIVPYWNVSYYSDGMPVGVESLNDPMVFTVIDQRTMREDATGTTYVRQ